MKDFIAIDFETANPKRVSACALGFARVNNGQIIEKNGILIRPVGGHAPFQTRIHGITEKHTSKKLDFCGLYPKIRQLFDYPLVGHSLFDKQVLNALSEHFSLGLNFDYTDSSAVAKKVLPGLKNHKLKTLAKHFDLPKFKHHDAADDAVACANIFLNLQPEGVPDTLQPPTVSKNGFSCLATDILEDKIVDYKEAYALLYWLEDNCAFANSHIELWNTVIEVLEDDVLTDDEAIRLKSIIEDTLAKLL